MSNKVTTLTVIPNAPVSITMTRRQKLLVLQELSEFLFAQSLRAGLVMIRTASRRKSKDLHHIPSCGSVGHSDEIGRISNSTIISRTNTPFTSWQLVDDTEYLHQAMSALDLFWQFDRFRQHSVSEKSVIVALVVAGVISLDRVLEVLEPIAETATLH